MPSFRVREAAELLGVSDDTVRRWADAGRLPTTVNGGRRAIDGAVLARFSEELARSDERTELVTGRRRIGPQPHARAWSPASCATR